jgi:hypothetical protein
MSRQLIMPFDGDQAAQLHREEYVDNLITTTWYDVRKQMFSDIFSITPLLDLLGSKGKIKSRLPNGRYFELPIGYAKADQNQKWFGRGDTFGEQEKQLWTRLQYQRRNLGDSIVRYWDDEQKNVGEAQILSYAKELLENHQMTMEDTLATALWEDQGTLAINTLPGLLPYDPTTGTVGGIDRAVNPYVRNQVFDMQSISIATELIPQMRTMYNQCSKMKGKGRTTPDCILTTQAIYEEYEDQALAKGEIQLANNRGTNRADLGLGGLSYKGAEMYWDPLCPAQTMYFLNSDTMEFAYDPNNYMTMTPWKGKHNSLDRYAQVVTVCNLLFNNFSKNGVLFGIGATA